MANSNELNALTKLIDTIRDKILRNDIDAALELNVIAYEKAIALEDKHNIAEALRHFASIEFALGHLSKTLTYGRKAYELAMEVENFKCVTAILNVMAGTYSLMGNNKEAITIYKKAIEIVELHGEIGFKKGIFYNNIGLTFFLLADYGPAEKYYLDALACSKEALKESYEDEILDSVIYSNLAELYIVTNQYELAEVYLKLAQSSAQLMDDQLGVGLCLGLEATYLFERTQNWEQAKELYKQAYLIVEKHGTDSENVECLIKYGKLAILAGDNPLGKTLLEEAEIMANKSKYLLLEAEILLALEAVYKSENHFEKAYHYAKRHIELQTILAKQWEEQPLHSFANEMPRVEDTRQIEDMKRTLQTINLLSEVGREVTEATNSKDIVDILANHITKVFKLNAFAIAFIDSEKKGVDLIAFDESGKQELYRTLDDERSFIAWCVRNKQELIIYDSKDESSYSSTLSPILRERLVATEINSALFCPLFNKDEIIGGITIQSNLRFNFSYVDLALFRLLVSYVAIAINNINKNEVLIQTNFKLEEAARIDGLTGLLNRRALGDFIIKQFEDIQKEWLPIGMFMIDLDYFKQFNDYYGHNKGDQCLIAVTKVIKNILSQFEKESKAYRFGGDEFLMIVKHCDEHTAKVLLDQIFEGIKALNIEHIKSKTSSMVTLTIGGSIVKRNISDYTEIFAQADDALYQAKHLGRNTYHLLVLE